MKVEGREREKKKEKPLCCGQSLGGFGPWGLNQTVSRAQSVECSILELRVFLNSVTSSGEQYRLYSFSDTFNSHWQEENAWER